MRVNNLIYKSSKFLNDKLGLYTKRQCVRVSTELGKDLADFKNKGGEITLEILQTYLKKHVPKANVEIITKNEDYEKRILSLGYEQAVVERLKQNMSAQYFNLLGGHGIYIPNYNSITSPEIFAHEVEHFMHSEHFLPSKIMLKFRDIVLSKELKNKSKKVDLKAFNNSCNGKKKNLEIFLRDYFGINKIEKEKGYNNEVLNKKNFYKFLASENFEGLTSEKRVKAYIRAIIRNIVHPTEENSFMRILAIKRIIADESRAYKVSDRVINYIENGNRTTYAGFRSYIYKITVELLKKEQLIALKHFILDTPAKKTGLPTCAYIGKQIK